MKKLIIAILAAILASGAFAQQSFPDIPEGHWAGDAVDRIADLNIVIGFPDGTFRGNEAFTRYQAALVVSRLLDVVSEDVDAALALADEDIASLRNAVQELSSDVAGQGTRLSAAEGAIAGLSDDVTSQGARLDEIEAALGDAEVDPAVLQDLQNQIASQRVAIDTAQATADEALSRANAADSQAAANAEEIAALNQLVQLLGDDVDALAGAGEGDDGALAARVARNEGDIANIREFVILLRRDQVALRDRVSALEDSDAQQTADIADLDERVAELERNPLGLEGTIGLSFLSGRYSGDPVVFDIDRAYGVNLDRTMWWDEEELQGSVFSSSDSDFDDEEEAVATGDIEYSAGSFETDSSLSFGTDLRGVGAVDEFSVSLDISIDRLADVISSPDATLDIEDNAFVLSIDGLAAQFALADDAVLSIDVGQEVEAVFTPYTLNTDDEDGLVATYQGGETLAFLDPTLQVVFLTGDAEDVPAGYDVFTTFGARLAVSPLDGLNVGVSYLTNEASPATEITDTLDDTIFGVDVDAALGPVALEAEYASASIGDGGYEDSILFVQAETEFDVLGGIEFSANYRDIAPGWEDAVASGVTLTDADDYEFEEDQAGFAVDLGVGVYIVDLGVHFDSYEVLSTGDDVTAFGVDAEAPLFAGFGVTAFYEQASVNGDLVEDLGDLDRDDHDHGTGFGIGIEHDGSAANALVDDLNLGFEFRQVGPDFDITELEANADYLLDVSIVELSPYVGYESRTNPAGEDLSTVKAGTGLVTESLDIFLQPSLEAAVNFRSTTHTDVPGEYTADQLQWSVGLVLNEFLLEHSTFTARYASYTSTNVDWEAPGFSSGSDEDLGDATGVVTGYELVWDYRGLELSHGGYFNENPETGTETYAQAFGVSYSIELE